MSECCALAGGGARRGGRCAGDNGVGAAAGGEGGDAGCAELVAGAGVGHGELDAVTVAGVDEEADAVIAGVPGEERDQLVEAGLILVGVVGLVEEEAEEPGAGRWPLVARRW